MTPFCCSTRHRLYGVRTGTLSPDARVHGAQQDVRVRRGTVGSICSDAGKPNTWNGTGARLPPMNQPGKPSTLKEGLSRNRKKSPCCIGSHYCLQFAGRSIY